MECNWNANGMECNGMQINKRKITGKAKYKWRLNKPLLNDTWVKQEILKEISNILS